ncbi:Hsp70 family protein [Crystallibacter degradans]|uniref:Hsp70 family protein n=1 Tax=Crystallibacter degradans TaxID=2726743 RepID=UPI0014734DD3|nr:Hsp70 family protein [Arthrobacter sp. SF27]NMR31770.1 Hsp70 family protein [Arthrobacter sp. SF27]
MAFVLGIDIGTSFSAAAVARLDSAGHPAPQVLNLGVRGGAVPSVIFLGEDGQVLVGEAAERRGTTHPDRLVREFKRRVGDAVPIVVGDLSVAPEDIVATMARWVVDRAQEREGEPPAAIAIAHPASWGGYKKDLVRQALAGVGLAEVTLVSEPEAAAVHYASQERVDEGSTIAVYDLGGGTFDAAVLQKSSAETFRTLGRPEGIERLGGADFDDAVFRHVAACAADALTGLDTSDPGVLMALVRLRRECTEAKEALSTDSEASIPVLLPGGQSQIRLVRSEFEGMIGDGVQQTIEALKRALQAADTDAGDLSAILLIGGSSRIPLVAQLLSAEFNRPIAIDADPKASISLGAAFSAAAMLAPVTAGAQAAPASPAASEEADLHSHGHRFGTDIGTSAPVASAKPAHPRTGARMTAVAAVVATLTILTATAAQSPAEMNPLAAGAAGAQASEEEGAAGTAPPPGGAAGPQGSGAGGPAGIQALDGSGETPITDNWQAVDADGSPAAGTAPADGTAGAGNNDGGKATPPKGSTAGTNARRPDSSSSTPKPTTKGTSQPAQESTAPAPQPEPPATGPAPTTPAQPPATQPPTTAEPPVTPAPDIPQTPAPEPPAPEQTAPASDPPAPAPPEPAPPEPAPPAPAATEPAADPVPSAPAPEVPATAPAPAPEG